MKRCRLFVGIALALTAGAVFAQGQEKEIWDPLERVNRGTFWFNEEFDRYVAKPVAQAYDWVLPRAVQKSVGNVFDNFAYPKTILNAFFQAKFSQGFADTGRFLTNSLLGIGGIFDFATPLGMPANKEDMGQTFGRWGVPQMMYIVWPILGPSTLRDSAGIAVDTFAIGDDLKYRTDDFSEYKDAYMYGVAVLDGIDTRARFLGAERVVKEAALDRYAFSRNAYLQRREAQVNDGETAPEEEEKLFGPLD